jgi:hypothetical protein
MFALASCTLGDWTSGVADAMSRTTSRALKFQPRQPNGFDESRFPGCPLSSPDPTMPHGAPESEAIL